MSRMEWNGLKGKDFHHGVDRGVLKVHNLTYPVPWPGLVAVKESSDRLENQRTYYDGQRIYNRQPPSHFKAEIEALYSPPEFDHCDGTLDHGGGLFSTNNESRNFDFSYRTRVGEGRDYRLHFVYDATAVPGDVVHQTISDTPSPSLLSWEVTTSSMYHPETRGRTHFYLDTTKTPYVAVLAVENMLYGTEDNDPHFPSYAQIKSIINSLATVKIIDHNSGWWTIDAPDHIARVIDEAGQEFLVDWLGVELINQYKFEIRGSD